jgi:hypothetical protein
VRVSYQNLGIRFVESEIRNLSYPKV